MQTSDIDTNKEIETKSPPKSFKLFMFILAAAVIIALIIVSTVDKNSLPL